MNCSIWLKIPRLDLRVLIAGFCIAAIAPLAAAQRSPKREPSSAYQRGLQAIRTGDVQQAQSEFEQAIRANPRDAGAHSALGWVLLVRNEPDAAIQHLHAALRLKPLLAQAHSYLGEALAQKNLPEEAITEFRTAIKLAPSNADAHRGLARTLAAQQHLDDAIVEMRQATRGPTPGRPA